MNANHTKAIDRALILLYTTTHQKPPGVMGCAPRVLVSADRGLRRDLRSAVEAMADAQDAAGDPGAAMLWRRWLRDLETPEDHHAQTARSLTECASHEAAGWWGEWLIVLASRRRSVPEVVKITKGGKTVDYVMVQAGAVLWEGRAVASWMAEQVTGALLSGQVGPHREHMQAWIWSHDAEDATDTTMGRLVAASAAAQVFAEVNGDASRMRANPEAVTEADALRMAGALSMAGANPTTVDLWHDLAQRLACGV